jgi:shikimate kinase
MPSSKAIVLVGPMGVGKTTIGKRLAKELKMPFVDTDALITKVHGDIAEIFERVGESGFREIEEDVVMSQLASRSVVATGGGAVLSSRTREAMTVASVVYLFTDGRHIANRLSKGNRPLLKNGASDWRAIYESRKRFYEQVADITVDTSGLSLADTVQVIKEKIGNDV